MNVKSVALFTLLTPCLALLAACDHNNTRSDMDDSMAPTSTESDMNSDSSMSSGTTDSSMSGDTSMSSSTGTATGGEMAFADLDANQDGSLTQDEVAADAMLSQHFTAADTDGDGKLSDAEVSQHRASMGTTPATP